MFDWSTWEGIKLLGTILHGKQKVWQEMVFKLHGKGVNYAKHRVRCIKRWRMIENTIGK